MNVPRNQIEIGNFPEQKAREKIQKKFEKIGNLEKKQQIS